MSMIELCFFIVMCLSINNPNKKCIVVPFINRVAFAMYVTILSFCCFHVFNNIIFNRFDYLCFTSTIAPHTYCNN
jgi:hypothetical protein